MDIEYKKQTLYVYLNEDVDVERMQNKVENIMDTYEINNLVIHTKGEKKHLHEFEWNYNTKHKTKVIIK